MARREAETLIRGIRMAQAARGLLYATRWWCRSGGCDPAALERLLLTAAIDYAILDLNLGGQTRLARGELGIPYFFAMKSEARRACARGADALR